MTNIYVHTRVLQHPGRIQAAERFHRMTVVPTTDGRRATLEHRQPSHLFPTTTPPRAA